MQGLSACTLVVESHSPFRILRGSSEFTELTGFTEEQASASTLESILGTDPTSLRQLSSSIETSSPATILMTAFTASKQSFLNQVSVEPHPEQGCCTLRMMVPHSPAQGVSNVKALDTPLPMLPRGQCDSLLEDFDDNALFGDLSLMAELQELATQERGGVATQEHSAIATQEPSAVATQDHSAVDTENMDAKAPPLPNLLSSTGASTTAVCKNQAAASSSLTSSPAAANAPPAPSAMQPQPSLGSHVLSDTMSSAAASDTSASDGKPLKKRRLHLKDPVARRQRQLERNRACAKASRLRKKFFVSSLEVSSGFICCH